MVKKGVIKKVPVHNSVAAVSVGKVDGKILLDLNYAEDSGAEVDMNVVMTGSGEFVEVQGTAENAVFSKGEMDVLIRVAEKGIRRLTKIQLRSLEEKG
jgi:ribonuclease PH